MIGLKELGLQPLKLNMNDDIRDIFIAKEGDYNSRGISLQVLKNNEVIDTTGIRVEFFARPEDDEVYKVVANEVNLKEGRYEIIFPLEILQAGDVVCEIRLVKDSKEAITTKQFIIKVGDKLW